MLVVAEAPGRLGGEITGVPLSRDQSGKRFERLIALAGLDRSQVLISNAVLCNPQDERGNNRPPARAELEHCRDWLCKLIDLQQPEVVITLGATALATLDRIEPHGLRLREAAAQPVRWRARWLWPQYHTSPRAGLSRSYLEQEDDFRRLGAWLREIGVSAAASARV